MHKKFITHNDIKCENILFSNINNKWVFCDYGSMLVISKVINGHYIKFEEFTKNNVNLTYQYCSPEILKEIFFIKNPNSNLDPFKNDFFAFGMVILRVIN